MKKIIFTILFCMMFAPFASSQKADLSVEVVLKDAVITAKTFEVQASIVNTSDKEQLVSMMSCPQQNYWIIDSLAILVVPVKCTESYPISKLLKMGEKLEQDIFLATSDQVKSGNLTFRLGFRLSKNNADHAVADEKIFWSDPVTITIP